MILFKCFALLLCLSGAYVSGKDLLPANNRICARGQSYWCHNISNAAECQAVKHCIMAVWEKEVPIEKDDSNVCQTCLEMVAEARDQLESNMTQAEIKEVMEGSCRLIPVPVVAKECIKLVDDFAPQLIDTLASQMNPQVVCSVAGLCYNARVHQLEAEYMMKLEREELDCLDGAGYWCKNISTAVECDQLKYCLNYVWEKANREGEDQSVVCQSCVNAFAQTRLQIDRASVPQDDVASMLQSACSKIPVRQEVEECYKFMNHYMPQLMQLVTSKTESRYACVVSGLCENPRLQAIENDYLMKRARAAELNCPNCNAVVREMQAKFQEMSENEFLNILMNICSEAGSFSDGCYAMIMTEHSSILEWLQNKLAPRPVCNLVSICRKPMTKPGQRVALYEVPEVKLKGDLPCDLCIQLVQHLRDILVSNTTQEDFKMVLHGICGQMDKWKDECNKLVDEYYTFAYEFLINSLNGQVLCKEINICPPSSEVNKQNTLIRPLQLGSEVESTKKPETQLPIERMDIISPLTRVPSTFLPVASPALCGMCEYFLHFVQQELTLPSTEEQIREIVSKECSKLPPSVLEQCNAFVDTYMDTLVALLAQEIDPSQICPRIGVCPGSLVSVPYTDKPACPLCLLALQEIYSRLNSSQVTKTLNNIGDIVDDLCLRDEFPPSVLVECAQFISKYRTQVINMVLTEFTPQESCAFIDVCHPAELQGDDTPTHGNIKTNEIEVVSESNSCVLCEFIMTKLADLLKDRTTEEEIKEAVFKICEYMPVSVKPKCDKFINQYADLLIQLLASEISPKEICTAMKICHDTTAIMKASLGPMEKCLMCEALMDGLRAVLTDPDVDQDINRQLMQACNFIPQRERDFCLSLVEQLAPQIEVALRTLPVGPIVCERIKLCRRNQKDFSAAVGNCGLGSSYWCQSSTAAAECNAIEYCQENVWMGNKPKKTHNLGRIVIDY